MSKAHRGAGIRDQVACGRGTCPICKKTAIKTIYGHEVDGKKINICKPCKAAIAHGKKQEALAAL